MIILCAGVTTPSQRAGKRITTVDGLDEDWEVNYLGNYHLLSILSPALRAQPADRDVRVILTTCSSYIGATMDLNNTVPGANNKQKRKQNSQLPQDMNKKPNMYATSKLALMIFAQSFQKHLDAYQRPDKQPNNARVLLVDPGFCRTPGTRRWLTGGSLWGLLAYLLTWPIWWLILKPPQLGAQNYLLASMEATLSCVGVRVTATMKAEANATEVNAQAGQSTADVTMIKECKERKILRSEVTNEAVGKELWEFSQSQIEAMEKEAAIRRAREKKEKEELEKREKEKEKERNRDDAREGNKAPAPGSRKSRKGK